MSDEASFLKAIADKPAERAARLVYADWLDEHDRPREAEFLRLQVRVADANSRLCELGTELKAKWLGSVGNLRTGPELLTLRSGRLIELRELRQTKFYEGSMREGEPTRKLHRESLGQLVETERARLGYAPHLVPPSEVASGAGRQLYPPLVYFGDYYSFTAARSASARASVLTVIWFQHEWAFPLDPGVRERIRAIDWEKHAHDFS